MQHVGVAPGGVWVEVEPTLPVWAGIPSDAEGLQAAGGHLDEVLLQRAHAEREGHWVGVPGAVGFIGLHDECGAIAGEARDGPTSLERGAAEVAEHGGIRRFLHGQGVVGTRPSLMRLGVARAAGGGPGILRVRRAGGPWFKRRWGVATEHQAEGRAGDASERPSRRPRGAARAAGAGHSLANCRRAAAKALGSAANGSGYAKSSRPI